MYFYNTSAITLDMGIVSPVMFICLHFLNRKDGVGEILLVIILTVCEFVGVMVIVQTIFQAIAGIEVPVPALVTKVGIFVVLGFFSVHFKRKYYKNLAD